jgi:starch phosphorylase
MINQDRNTRDLLKVVFLPNYRVTLAEKIIPAADLSEQISTAGFEASGTGNMKFMMNGALTIGTLDGANVEIREQVGDDNFFIFGMSAEEVSRARPHYRPRDFRDRDPLLAETLQLIRSGFFNPEQRGMFHGLVDNLLERDPYFVLADFDSYVQCQARVSELWCAPDEWCRKTILNVARSGVFSSDRTIRQYNSDIWRATPLSVSRPK